MTKKTRYGRFTMHRLSHQLCGSALLYCQPFSTAALKHHFIFWLIITATQFPQLLGAADNAKGLTLLEAIQRTFNAHPQLQAFQYRLDAQQGKVIQANLSPKPEVELTIEDALGSGEFSGFGGAQTTLSVSWVLDQRIKHKRAAVASQAKTLIESDRAITQLDSATETARYFLTALSHQEGKVVANRAITMAQTSVKEIKHRVAAGKSPLAELYRAEAELAKRKLARDDLMHELQSSLRQLAAQWGSTTPTFNSVAGSLANQPNVISFHALKSQIMHNPSLTKYLSLERVKEAELKLAQEQRKPKWKFSTGIRHFARSDDVGLVATLSVPLGGNNHNQGRIATVRAEIAQQQADADALRIRIETTLFLVYQQLKHKIHLSDMWKNDIIPRLEQALTETHEAYELGKYSYLEWLAVQNDLLDAQSALLDASLAAHLNKIELERLTGAQISSPF